MYFIAANGANVASQGGAAQTQGVHNQPNGAFTRGRGGRSRNRRRDRNQNNSHPYRNQNFNGNRFFDRNDDMKVIILAAQLQASAKLAGFFSTRAPTARFYL